MIVANSLVAIDIPSWRQPAEMLGSSTYLHPLWFINVPCWISTARVP